MGNPGYLPTLACELARSGACLVGLVNRWLYSSASRMFTESLALPNKPAGYEDICQLVTTGALSEAEQIVKIANRFWEGVADWAEANQIHIAAELGDLLEQR